MPVLRFGWGWSVGLHGCSSGVLQGHTFLLLVQSTTMGAWGGVSGLALDPGDMQAVYPPHGMAADWATYSPGM